jgi:hypothetical protein
VDTAWSGEEIPTWTALPWIGSGREEEVIESSVTTLCHLYLAGREREKGDQEGEEREGERATTRYLVVVVVAADSRSVKRRDGGDPARHRRPRTSWRRLAVAAFWWT